MSCQINVSCPRCGSDQITRAGKSASGEQRYRCRAEACSTSPFMLNYRYTADQPGIKRQIVEIAINGSDVRNTSRVLMVSKGTVMSTLKKVQNARPGKPSLPVHSDGTSGFNGQPGA